MEINVLTGEPIKKRREDDELYFNIYTHTFEKRRDNKGLVYNSVTGMYDSADEEETGIKKAEKWPSILSDEEEDDDDEFEKFERPIPIFIDKAKTDEHIVCGIVYEPDTVDAQGDKASAEEIRKAAYHFMENVQKFKVNHKGDFAKVKVLESYIAPEDLTVAGQPIKKGTWVLVTRVLDDKVWEDIKDGKLTGYSMAGYAKAS